MAEKDADKNAASLLNGSEKLISLLERSRELDEETIRMFPELIQIADQYLVMDEEDVHPSTEERIKYLKGMKASASFSF